MEQMGSQNQDKSTFLGALVLPTLNKNTIVNQTRKVEDSLHLNLENLLLTELGHKSSASPERLWFPQDGHLYLLKFVPGFHLRKPVLYYCMPKFKPMH